MFRKATLSCKKESVRSDITGGRVQTNDWENVLLINDFWWENESKNSEKPTTHKKLKW